MIDIDKLTDQIRSIPAEERNRLLAEYMKVYDMFSKEYEFQSELMEFLKNSDFPKKELIEERSKYLTEFLLCNLRSCNIALSSVHNLEKKNETR